MRQCSWIGGFLLLLGSFSTRSAIGSITFGQTDSFQSSDALGWTRGLNALSYPSVVSSGGPSGAGDGYLSNVSTGTSSANSRMVMFNEDQWTGNYISAGVTLITAEMADSGPDPLSMRVAIQDNIGTDYASTNAVPLPADSQWHAVSFDMTASGLSHIVGSDSLTQSLSNVVDVWILSNINFPSIKPAGDAVAATLGVDDITAAPEPTALLPLAAALVLCRRRPRQ